MTGSSTCRPLLPRRASFVLLLLIVWPAWVGGQCVSPPTGLVAWWPFDERRGATARDLSGKGHDGTYGGQPTAEPGIVRDALSFSAQDFVAAPVASHDPRALTIDGWVSLAGSYVVPPDPYPEPILQFLADAGFGYKLLVTDGHLALLAGCTAEGATIQQTPGPVLTPGVSRHIAVVVDAEAQAVTFYVDGDRVAGFTTDLELCSGSGAWQIGGTTPSVAPFFDVSNPFAGLVDELEVFERALGPEEIAAIAQAGGAGKCKPSQCASPPPGMVAWWGFDEAAGPTALDNAGGHHGTWVGQPAPLPGVVRRALRFDSADGGDSVQVPDDPALRFGTDDFTIDAWILRQGTGTLLVKRANAEELGYGVDIDASSSALRFGSVTSTVPLPMNVWTHVAVTTAASNGVRLVSFYVDGSLTNTEIAPLTAFDATGDLVLGESFVGLLDEVQMFDRSLTADEVATIYAGGCDGECRPAPPMPIFRPSDGCLKAVAKGVGLAARENAAALADCKLKASQDPTQDDAVCTDPQSADLKGRVARAEQKLRLAVEKSCAAGDVVGYSACPLSAGALGGTPITSSADLGVCLVTVVRGVVTEMAEIVSPGVALPAKAEQKCQQTIARGYGKLLATVLKVRTRCELAVARGALPEATDCVVEDPTGKIARATVKLEATVARTCAGTDAASVSPCGVDAPCARAAVDRAGEGLFRASAARAPEYDTCPLVFPFGCGQNRDGICGGLCGDGEQCLSFGGAPCECVRSGLACGPNACQRTAPCPSRNEECLPLLCECGPRPPSYSLVDPPGCLPPPADLVAWWPFDESSGATALDIIGGKHGTILGGTSRKPGAVGGALFFHGRGDYVEVPDAPALALSGGVTMDAWVYPEEDPRHEPILAKMNTGHTVGFRLMSASRFHIHVCPSTNCATGFWSVPPLPTKRWTHVAFVLDPVLAQYRLYVNGELKAKAMYSGTPFVTVGRPLWIAARPDVGEYFKGGIDEVELFARALGDSEIKAIFLHDGKCRPPA